MSHRLRFERMVPYEERMKFSIAEKICKDKNYVEIRRFFEMIPE